MRFRSSLSILLAIAMNHFAFADTDATAPKSATVLKMLKEMKYEETHTLTDSKLLADDGSLSRYSMKGSFSYYGPALGDLKAPDQPNPDGTVGNYAQAIKGSAMLRYRVNSTNALSGGTGIAANHPFHGWDRTDANNPFISWDHASRWGEVQVRQSPGATLATVPNYTATGEVGGLTYDLATVHRFESSKFSLSFDTNFSWWIYKRSYRPGSPKKGGDGHAQEYSLGVYPGAKYNFSDSFNVFGSYGVGFYNPRELENKSALWRRTPSLKAGFSIAFGRDIYFAPYIMTYPSQAFMRSTTVNFATVFSLL